MAGFIRFLTIFLGLNLAVALPVTSWAAPEEIGRAVSVTGSVKAETAEDSRMLEVGSPVFRGESIRSDPDSRAQIKFVDDSLLSVGPSSTISLDEYVFTEKDQGLLFRMGQGGFRIITGKIAEQNPDRFSMETPASIIGIRGTTIGVIVHATHVTISALEITPPSSIWVTNPDFPDIISFLTVPGTSVDVFPGQPPGPPRPTTSDDLDELDLVDDVPVDVPVEVMEVTPPEPPPSPPARDDDPASPIEP